MVALSINSTKSIMGALLMTEAFDNFRVEEVTISTFNTFSIDGHINKDFFTSEEISEAPNGLPVFSSWQEIKPICFQLIKGKKTPVSFRFILHADDSLIDEFCQKDELTISRDMIKGLILNIRYENGKVNIITGCSYNSFVMDKSMDNIWDKYLPHLLSDLKIDFEEI